MVALVTQISEMQEQQIQVVVVVAVWVVANGGRQQAVQVS
jgi:hypothetical protein